MKKVKNGIRIITAMCAALGWWGLFYPGLTLTPDTVSIICEDENGGESISADPESFDAGLYLELLGTDRSSIRFRSRLLTELNALWEAFSWDRSTKN
ncbi:MAG: hypothetical protein NC517_04445 [Firmicutes bacterium]|nr:hypothetical protein [Bacillota bacterium]